MLLSPELRGKTLGIIGLGSVGCEVARVAHDGFGMRIATNRNPHLKLERAWAAHAEDSSRTRTGRSPSQLNAAVPSTPPVKRYTTSNALALSMSLNRSTVDSVYLSSGRMTYLSFLNPVVLCISAAPSGSSGIDDRPGNTMVATNDNHCGSCCP